MKIKALNVRHEVTGREQQPRVPRTDREAPLDQRPRLVLSWHHDGHPSHAADVGGSEGGRRRWAVGVRCSQDLGQLAIALLC